MTETVESADFEPVSGRLFVAIVPPDYVADAVEQLQEGEGHLRGLTWVAPEKLHLTLAFFGEVDPERQAELVRRLPEAKVRPFYLELGGLGVFPRKGKPQVLWAGCPRADPLLFQLHGKVERILLDLGFEPDRRRYNPHLTIARCGASGEPAVRNILKKYADFGSAPFLVNDIFLYASQRGPRGSVYKKLAHVPF